VKREIRERGQHVLAMQFFVDKSQINHHGAPQDPPETALDRLGQPRIIEEQYRDEQDDLGQYKVNERQIEKRIPIDGEDDPP